MTTEFDLLELQIGTHLTHNIFPPLPKGWIPYCKQAIELFNAGRGDEQIQLRGDLIVYPNTTNEDYFGRPESIKASDLVEAMKLHQMIDYDFGWVTEYE